MRDTKVQGNRFTVSVITGFGGGGGNKILKKQNSCLEQTQNC
jgi:hypothetical protein